MQGSLKTRVLLGARSGETGQDNKSAGISQQFTLERSQPGCTNVPPRRLHLIVLDYIPEDLTRDVIYRRIYRNCRRSRPELAKKIVFSDLSALHTITKLPKDFQDDFINGTCRVFLFELIKHLSRVIRWNTVAFG